ncbi:MAG: protein kinase [Planctomycetales bacterium]|nr:protein kinase [Planctomycetales bacterium]
MNSEDPQEDPDDFLSDHESSLADTVQFDATVLPEPGWDFDVADDLVSTTRYHMLERIGEGGMGVVYRAIDVNLCRVVAIKVLKPQYQKDEQVLRRFWDEALIKSSLQHPGVIPVYSVGNLPDERPYYSMKLIAGASLAKLISESLPHQRLALLPHLVQCCQTVAYAHAHGVIHLDLKPANIMVGDFGRVRVIDWGLARRLEGDQLPIETSTIYEPSVVDGHTGRIRGTPEYMAPEQARGEAVDARSDVFSLGAILCEILTGRSIYHGVESARLLRHAMRGQLEEAMQRLHQTQGEIWLLELVKRCLSPSPNDRPKDANELATSLQRLQKTPLELLASDMQRFWELSPDLFCIADLDGYFRQVNSNFLRVLGYTEHELLSQPFLNFVHIDDRPSTMAQVANLGRGQDVIRFCNRYLTSAGDVRLLEWTAKSVPEEHLIFAVARDVTPGAIPS